MRVNVYAEEIDGRGELVEKIADTGARFLGVRFYLRSPPELHRRPDDDDSSAVTFWIRSSAIGYRPGDERPLHLLFQKACDLIQQKRCRAYNAEREGGGA